MKGSRRLLTNLFLNSLPLYLRDNFIRGQVNLPRELGSNLSFKLADTEAELEQAFRILHDNYVQQGFMSPRTCGLRVTPHFVLPTTVTLVGKDQDKVIGTLSIIRDSVLGLPLEKVFDISEIKAKSQRYAEISALAITRGYRRSHGGQVFFPLLKLMYEFCIHSLDVQDLLIVIEPKTEDFYRALLHFERLPNTGIVDYMGAPAIVMHLDLVEARAKFQQTYKDLSDARDLYTFFVDKKFPQLQLPQHPYYVKSHPVLTADIFENLLLKKAGLYEVMSFQDCLKLRTALNGSPLLPLLEGTSEDQKRKAPRFEVRMPAVYQEDNRIYKVMLKQISRTGVCVIQTEKEDITHEQLKLSVEVGPGVFSDLVLNKVWSRKGVLGFEIAQSDSTWESVIQYLSGVHQFRKRLRVA